MKAQGNTAAKPVAGHGFIAFMQRASVAARTAARALAALCAIGAVAGLAPASGARAAAAPSPAPSPTLVLDAGTHTGAIRRLAVSPDQTRLVTVGDDKAARVWEIGTRRLLMTLRWPVGGGDLGRMYGAAFSPDGREIAIGGTSGSTSGSTSSDAAGGASGAAPGHRLEVFSAIDGHLLRRLPLDAGHVVRLLWSRSGRHLAACLSGTNGIRILAADGSTRFADSFDAPCFGLAELPDGSILASGYDARIRHYRPQPGGGWALERQVGTEAPEPRSLAVSPDGRFVAVGYNARPASGEALVDVLDSATLALARRITLPGLHRNQAGVGSVAWSADGRTIAAAGRATSNKDVRAQVVLQRIAWPEGKVQTDFVATDTVQDLAAWGGHGFVLGSGLGSWMAIDAEGPVSPLGAAVIDLRGADNLAIDANARVVAFADSGWSGARHFRLARRELADGTGEGTATASHRAWSWTIRDWQDRLHPVVGGREQPMEPAEVSRALALLPDNSAAILGTTKTLRRIDRDGQTQWSVRTPSEVTAVHASADGRLVVGTVLDGTVRWWRASDGMLLLSLFTSLDGRWVLWTEQGYFDTSIGGDSLVGWQLERRDGRGVDFFSVGRFRERYQRPDVIDAVLEQLDPALALASADARRREYVDAGPAPSGTAGAAPTLAAAPPPAAAAPVPAAAAPTAGALAPELLPPVLAVPHERIVESSVTRLVLRFALLSHGAPARVVRARVDGRPAEVVRARLPTRQDGVASGEIVLSMPERDAELTLIADNGLLVSEPVQIGWRWRPARSPQARLLPTSLALPPAPQAPLGAGLQPVVDTTSAARVGPAASAAAGLAAARRAGGETEHGRLILLAIGISSYARPDYALDLPAKDANDFNALMRTQEGRFYREVVSRVLTDGQATRAQVLQGLAWLREVARSEDTVMLFMAGHGVNDARGRYFFLPHDADIERLGATGIGEAQLRESLSEIRGKVMMFVDTCHAGNVVGRGAALSNEVTRVTNTLSAAENGVIVFSSSTGRQESMERRSWGNGAFTKVLLQGLQGAADFRREGLVTHNALGFFLGRGVSLLTGGLQTPVTAVPLGVVDFAMVAVGGG